MTPLGSLASQLSVAIAFAFLFGVALSLPLNPPSRRWSAASVPVVGLRLTIVALGLLGTSVAMGLLPWLTWYASVATLLLFGWPLLLPQSEARWDSLLLIVNTLLVVALAATIGMNPVSGNFWLGGIWGIPGTIVALAVAIAIVVTRPPRWPIFLAGYLVLALAFALETWMLAGPLPAAELVVYPLMIYVVLRTLVATRDEVGAAQKDPSAFARALSVFENAMEPQLLTYSGLRLISQFLQARYGLLFSGPDQSGSLGLEAAVDAAGEMEISVPPLQSRALPAVTAAVVRGRAKFIRKEDELAALRDALGLRPTGEAIISPLRLDGDRIGGLMLLASTELRTWTAAELETLEAWSHYLGSKLSGAEPDHMGQAARPLAVALTSSNDTPIGLQEDSETLKGELRLALEELAEVSAVESGDSMRGVGSLTAALMNMRDPIESIQEYSDMLGDEALGNLDADQRRFLDYIRENSLRLEGQLEDLLRLVREPARTEQPAIDIHAIVNTAAAQVGADIRDKQVEIAFDLPAELPMVQAEPDVLRQIVVILLERAVKLSAKGAEIQVIGSSDEEQWVSIAVVDQGPGVAPEDIGRIFQYGGEGDGTTMGESGLPQVKTLTESLGGRVWIGSEIGAGSTITVMIPAGSDTASSERSDTTSEGTADNLL